MSATSYSKRSRLPSGNAGRCNDPANPPRSAVFAASIGNFAVGENILLVFPVPVIIHHPPSWKAGDDERIAVRCYDNNLDYHFEFCNIDRPAEDQLAIIRPPDDGQLIVICEDDINPANAANPDYQEVLIYVRDNFGGRMQPFAARAVS